jgi:hypothetical protein
MKPSLIIVIIASFICGCNQPHKQADYSYVKVFTTIGAVDSLNAVNKGWGIENYLFYDPNKDSFVFRRIVSVEPLRYETYIGRISETPYFDSLQYLVKALRHRKEQSLYEETEGAVYCGPNYYAEFKDSTGLRYFNYPSYVNDTIGTASNLLFRLASLPWDKDRVVNNLVNADLEIAEALKKLGYYSDYATPTSPASCPITVNKEKIYGTWKLFEDRFPRTIGTYTTMTFTKKGEYIIKFYHEGKSDGRDLGKFRFDSDGKGALHIFPKKNISCKVLKLEDKCMEVQYEDGSTSRFDKI